MVGTKTVQDQHKQSLLLDGQSEEAIPQPVLPMEIRICIMKIMKHTDLYNKSRVMGDYQARFCERLWVKLPLPTRHSVASGKLKNRKKMINLVCLRAKVNF